MPEQHSNDAAATTVQDFADKHELTEVQAKEILDLAGGDADKASRFLEKKRVKGLEGAGLREPLSAEFT
jgi:hypothetical protein